MKTDKEVEGCFLNLTKEELEISQKRGFSHDQVKKWIKYGEVPGFPGIIPTIEIEPYELPDW